MNLYEITLAVQLISTVARSLPPLDQAIEEMEAAELECERTGKFVPTEALKHMMPVYQAAAVFQKVCQAAGRPLAPEPEIKL